MHEEPMNQPLTAKAFTEAPQLLRTPPAPLLEPNRLNEVAQAAIDSLYRESHSANTTRSYKTSLQYWGAWHALRYGVALTAPVSPATVLQFIVDHIEHNPTMLPPELSPFSQPSATTQHLLPPAIDQALVERQYKAKLGPWTYATVKSRLAALSKAHERFIGDNPHLKLGPEANPLRDPKVRDLLSAVRRVYGRRARPPRRPAAATRPIMESLLATCGNDLAGIRDRALLLFGWASGGRRRSEITAARFDNVTRDGDGFIYDLSHSKTNQSGRQDPSNLKPIVGMAAEALNAWLKCLLDSGVTSGALFRTLHQGRIGDPLKPHAVREIIQRRNRLAGNLGRLSAHSLRSGFVTEAGKQGIPLGETMALTGHKSVQTAMGYYHAGEVLTTRAARLLEAEPPKKF
jgi:integrase